MWGTKSSSPHFFSSDAVPPVTPKFRKHFSISVVLVVSIPTPQDFEEVCLELSAFRGIVFDFSHTHAQPLIYLCAFYGILFSEKTSTNPLTIFVYINGLHFLS